MTTTTTTTTTTSRLQILQATHKGLLLEVQREYKIASSQLQIVYNLVAQRDNKSNYDIARTAKEDSFAMFTLATMSILFLPGASIATLFFMELFNRSPENGESIVNPRFWMFWAVAGPLTVIVLIVWLLWLGWHRHSEDRKSRGSPNGLVGRQSLACNLRKAKLAANPAPEAHLETSLRRRSPSTRGPFIPDVEQAHEMPVAQAGGSRIERTMSEGPRVPATVVRSTWKKTVSRSYTSAPEGPRRY
ncbi:hypothetical protein CSOJ01_09988 [Colletotrichum sojae]|uniref:CorA-like Mg2+ transporter n=1 Tax=Colletotrichum sojae TaxID=2175907 RepID=A0A8H6MQP3_9PEZI|nr:hypothetical protein CSOJ01_09988 [Colletotrichum sojae]